MTNHINPAGRASGFAGIPRLIGRAPQGAVRTTAPAGASANTVAARGVAAVRAMHQQETSEVSRRAAERVYVPRRFYLSNPAGQNVTPDRLEANIIILDEEPGFALWEHQFRNPPGSQDIYDYVTCLKGEGHCPACEVDQYDSSYTLMLSVIDMRAYTGSDGRLVPFTRKLLPVKNRDQEFFFRLHEQHGSLRAVQLLMVRSQVRGSAIGEPTFIDKFDDEAILATFSHAAIIAADGATVIKDENADCYAYNYDEIFPKPDYNTYLRRFGGAPAAGSSADASGVWGADAGQFANARGPATGRTITRGPIAPVNSRSFMPQQRHGREMPHDDAGDDGQRGQVQQGQQVQTRTITTPASTNQDHDQAVGTVRTRSRSRAAVPGQSSTPTGAAVSDGIPY